MAPRLLYRAGMKNFLVALDGSERAREVLVAARALAESSNGKLVLLRAVTVPIGVPAGAYAFPPDNLEVLLLREAQRELDAFAAELPPSIVGGTRVELGSPWRAICDAAREARVDLIVIGSHGYGGLDRLLGTTAAKVVNHADCSVLVVRAPQPAAA